jgi:DNA-binding CsgD family transcriptional regulator
LSKKTASEFDAPKLKRNAVAAIITDFGANLKERPSLAVGYALFCAWTWVVCFSLLLKPDFVAEIRPSLAWTISSASVAAGFIIVGILFKTLRVVFSGPWYLRVMALLMSGGMLVCAWAFYLPDGSASGLPVFIVGSVLNGLGGAFMHLEFQRIFGHLGARQTVVFSIIGVTGAACVIALIRAIPLGAVWALMVAIPVANHLILKRNLCARLYSWGLGAELRVPWKLAITMFLQGLSFGIMQSFSLLHAFRDNALLYTALCFAIASVLIFATALFFRLDFNHLIYQIGFPLMALGYLVAAFFASGSTSGIMLHAIGYRFVGILGWVLCAHLVRQRGLSTNWVFPWSVASLMIGSVVGSIIGEGSLMNAAPAGKNTPEVALVMVFVLLFSALLMFNIKNLRSGWGLFRPSDIEDAADGIAATCQQISYEYELTAREAEILVLLARGYDRAFMCDKLVLSKETIKTHVRNTYHKLGLHSQQEVIMLVESKAGEA